jgi:hypothetical protein
MAGGGGPAGATTQGFAGIAGGTGTVGSAGHGGSASSASLVGRLPAALFDRARADLRAGLASAAFTDAATGQVIRRTLDGAGVIAPAVDGNASVANAGDDGSVQDSLSSREWQELVDEVVRRIEGRVTAELARRGRRSMPRSF